MDALLTDELWNAVKPRLTVHRPSPKGGRRFCDDRKCLEGILYVLRGGIPWRLLPKSFGVSPSTCWRRFHEWTMAGVFDEVHRSLLRDMAQEDQLDTKRAIIDSGSVRALKGGYTPARTRQTAPSPAASGM